MAHVADHLSFATLADLEQVVTERCRVLNHDQLKPGTNFHWWPKPVVAQARHPGLISRKPYHTDAICRQVEVHGITPNIPSKANRVRICCGAWSAAATAAGPAVAVICPPGTITMCGRARCRGAPLWRQSGAEPGTSRHASLRILSGEISARFCSARRSSRQPWSEP